jgi:hypothetical protein
MKTFLLSLRSAVSIGVVGGSDLSKIKEQLGPNSALTLKRNLQNAFLLKQSHVIPNSNSFITQLWMRLTTFSLRTA